MKKLPLRAVLAIAAAAIFIALCIANTREEHLIDVAGWSHCAENTVCWGEEPTDIGTPADVLLFAFNLPAMIALLPLLPLTYWVDSEIVLRAAWGVASVGQWFLIGRYLDVRRGLVDEIRWNLKLPIRQVLFLAVMVAGAIAFVEGIYSGVSGHSSGWAFVLDGGAVFWGLMFLIFALRWRATFEPSAVEINSLRLS